MVRLANGEAYVDVARAYGPRIMGYGRLGGRNLLGAAPEAAQETPAGTWRAYGGHRLWIAPERFPETYTIDDAAPEIVPLDSRSLIVRRAPDAATGFRVEMQLTLAAAGTGLRIRHRITNRGAAAARVAPWGITIVAPGGAALIPNAPKRSQREALLPARTLTLWHYTTFGDGRIRFGDHFTQVACVAALSAPTKLGVACEQGWFAYALPDATLVVRTPWDAHAEYPDRGCNVEVYTEGALCEVEALGALVNLEPGMAAEHIVDWEIAPGVGDLAGAADRACVAPPVDGRAA